MKKTTGLTAAIFATAVIVLGTATGASAVVPSTDSSSPPPPPPTEPDRVIYVDHPAPKPENQRIISNGERTQATVADASEFPVIPEPGETVRIVYTDAATNITTLAPADAAAKAACTQSITVDTPYKSNNRARVSGSAIVTSGCGGSSTTFTLRLYGANILRGDGSINVLHNGSSWGLGVLTGACDNTGNTGYYGIGNLGSSGSNWGPSATLACGFIW